MSQSVNNLMRGLKSLIWPEKKLLFAGIGSILGFASDFATFLTKFGSPWLWLSVAAVLTLLFALICTPKIFRSNLEDPGAVDAVSKCMECDLLRLSLFTTFGLVLLLAIGQGQTATERIGRQLGVIEQKLDVVAETTEKIDETTTAIRDVTASGEIIASPKTAEDYYRNAFIYSYMRQNAAKAWESIEGLYDRFGPSKMDAAEMYYTLARQNLTRDDVFARMTAAARKHSDATLLVVVARNTPDFAKADALYAEARQIDPDFAQAYWDIQRPIDVNAGADAIRDPAGQAVKTRANIELIRQGIEAAARTPQGRYYFQPQYAPDMQSFLEQALAGQQSMLQSQEQLSRVRAPR
jgi:tetratricopeptide (TPR) repeat protein